MKFNAVIAAGLILFASCTNFKKKNGLQNEGLNGDVSQVTQTTFDAVEKFGEVMKGKVTSNYVLKYNRNGDMIESDEAYFYDSSSTNRSKMRFEYNDKHQQIAYKSIDKGNNFNGIIKNDAEGNAVEEESYNDGKLTSKTKLVYDNRHLVKDIYRYNAAGKLIAKSSYTRNSGGLPTEIISYDSTGVVDYTRTITYDSEGLPTGTKISGKYNSAYTYKFSRKDGHGNWLTKIEYYDGKLNSITERKILYY